MSSKPSLKAKLSNKELVVGGWVMLGHPGIAEIMARSGLDWVCIDLEHSAITLQNAEELIRTVESCGVPALVRLTNNDENLIKRVMDSGAAGIIIPLIKTAEDAKNAVSYMHYPPKGVRGVGLARGQGYGASFDTYKTWLEKEAVCIVQIEHIEAVENIEEILSVEGVDAYMIGPYDLSTSMGRPGNLEHADVLNAIKAVKEAGEKVGKPGGVHLVEPDENRLKSLISDGFSFIAYSIDTRMLDTACRNAVTIGKKG